MKGLNARLEVALPKFRVIAVPQSLEFFPKFSEEFEGAEVGGGAGAEFAGTQIELGLDPLNEIGDT